MEITKVSEGISNFIEKCTDEIISMVVIGGVLYLVYLGFAIPEALWVAFGLVIQYYFTKKTIGYLNNNTNGT